MKLFGFGIFENVQTQVDKTHAALRASLRPPEKGVFGSYKLTLVSGIMAAGLAAGSPIFAVRWGSSAANMLLRKLKFTAATDVTAFAQGSAIFDFIRASKLPAQYTGGANVTLLGKDQAKSTRFAASQQQPINAVATGNIAIANTATLVAGAPAPTLDSNALAAILTSVGAVPANLNINGYLIDPTEAARDPEEFQNGEGGVIRATVPATGTWKFGVEIEWDEIDPARYYGNF